MPELTLVVNKIESKRRNGKRTEKIIHEIVLKENYYYNFIQTKIQIKNGYITSVQ